MAVGMPRGLFGCWCRQSRFASLCSPENSLSGRGPARGAVLAGRSMAAKRAAFLEASDRLREKTRGRKQTPAEVLIREDRDDF